MWRSDQPYILIISFSRGVYSLSVAFSFKSSILPINFRLTQFYSVITFKSVFCLVFLLDETCVLRARNF